MLSSNAEKLERTTGDDFLTPDMSHYIWVLNSMLPKFGLLDIETIKKVVAAYGVVEQHYETLIILAGKVEDRISHWPLVRLRCAA